MKRCLILANGAPPKKSDLKYLQSVGFKTLICADGGANSALKLGITPDFIIGDLDSILPGTLNYFKEVKTTKLNRQNDTDVEKALKFASSMGYKEAVLCGATGDRLDHTFCNLGITLKFFDKIRTHILHQKTLLAVYNKTTMLKTLPEEIISIYGFDEKTKISTRGLKYPLNREALPFGKRESTSNAALSTFVEIKLSGGKIFVIREFNKLKQNDFFLNS